MLGHGFLTTNTEKTAAAVNGQRPEV